MAGTSFKFYDNSHVCIGLPLALREVYRTDEFGKTIRLLFEPTNITTGDSGGTLVLNVTSNYYKETYVTKFVGLTTGLYFSSAVFLGLNCTCFLIILVCYIEIVNVTKRSAQDVGRNRDMKEQMKLTSKVTAIVGTDFCCWFPIVIMGILVQTKMITLPPLVYAWSVSVVLPINSAINPYLYTVGEIISRRR